MNDLTSATDAELIAEVLRRQLAKGRLVTPEPILVGGVEQHAGGYTLAYVGR